MLSPIGSSPGRTGSIEIILPLFERRIFRTCCDRRPAVARIWSGRSNRRPRPSPPPAIRAIRPRARLDLRRTDRSDGPLSCSLPWGVSSEVAAILETELASPCDASLDPDQAWLRAAAALSQQDKDEQQHS